jgi:hypothetical protein
LVIQDASVFGIVYYDVDENSVAMDNRHITVACTIEHHGTGVCIVCPFFHGGTGKGPERVIHERHLQEKKHVREEGNE